MSQKGRPNGLDWQNLPTVITIGHNLRAADIRHPEPEYTFHELKFRFGMPFRSEEDVTQFAQQLRENHSLRAQVRSLGAGAIKLVALIPSLFRQGSVESVDAIHVTDTDDVEVIKIKELDEHSLVLVR
jgi:hypothetical protein